MSTASRPISAVHGTGRSCADLREHIANLEAAGLLRRVSKGVDNTWEISCIARWVFQSNDDPDRYALLFEKVGDFGVPVVVGAIAGSKAIYSRTLGVPTDQFYPHWIQAMERPLAPEKVPTGVVKEVIKTGDDVNLFELPIVIWTPQKDGGPYIGGHAVITKDPETDAHNAGTYRILVKDRNTMVLNIYDYQHIGIHLEKWRRLRKRMPVAFTIGAHPCLAATGTAKIPYGVEEYAVAGALNRAPLRITPAETCDLFVPADAEYVIEGEVDPEETAMEGPFGEYIGYMSLHFRKHVFHIKAVTHRKHPIFQSYVSQMPPSESFLMQSVPMGATLYKHLVNDLKIPGIKEIAYTEGSAKLHVIISIRAQYPGHSRMVLHTAAHLLEGNQPKRVTVVDDDIDVNDPFLVEWATTFRVDPEKDVVVVSGVKPAMGDPATFYDLPPEGEVRPLSRRDFGSKLLVDATIKKPFPAISLPPADLMYRAYDEWNQLGLPPITVRERTRLLLERHGGSNIYIDPFPVKKYGGGE